MNRREYEILLSAMRMLAREVQIGTSRAGFICPKCRGGRTSENSFSISRVDAFTALFCCHRGSCGFNGRVGRAFGDFISEKPDESSDGGCSRISRTPEFQGRPFTGEVRLLGEMWLSELCGSYGFVFEDIARLGWLEEVAKRRLVVPVRGPFGSTRGVQTRVGKFTGISSRKSYDYPEIDEPWMGWWFPYEPSIRSSDQASPVVLVEDVLSAAKVASAGYPSVSLMGSHLSLDALTEVQEHSSGPVILALDRDATSKALRLAARWGFLASGLQVLILDRDLKYEPITKIKEMVESVVT